MISEMQRSFIIPLVLVITILTNNYESKQQPTRSISIQKENLKHGSIHIYFVCPNVRSPNDITRYYKIENEIKGLKEKKKAFGIILKIKEESDLGTYGCSVVSTDKSTRNATLNIMDIKKLESPSKFVYDVTKTKYVIQKSGTVELDCGAPADQQVTWYRPAQYHIYTGNKLKLEDVSNFDYGAYYCAIGITTKAVLAVTKIILLPEEMKQKEKSIDEDVTYFENLIPKSREIRYRPGDASTNPDTITWEQPPGTILLEHGRDYYSQSYAESQSEIPFYYRIYRNGDYLVNKAGKLFISKWLEREIEMSVDGQVAYGNKLKVKCFPAPELGNNTVVVWKKDNVVIHTGNVLIIENFQKETFGKYSCEITIDGRQVKSKNIDLALSKDVQQKIEMTTDPGKYYSYHSGKKKELHCEITRNENNWNFNSKEIIWTFKGRKIEKGNPLSAFGNTNRFGRLNSKSVSILVLLDLDLDNEGTYKCFQGSSAFAATLIMEKSEVLIELAPPVQTVADNVNQPAEFHCRIDTAGINSSFIKWSFQPLNSNVYESLPAEAKVERPFITSSTSFVNIENCLKRHEGSYVCEVLGKKVIGQLIVKARPVLTVNPREITVKPGGVARFLCQLTGIESSVIWRRLDKKEFIVNKEKRIGGSVNSLLEIEPASASDDGTVYECSYNKLTELVTLWVKEDCPLSQRNCKNETCIDETKFCDGKNDCGDNSDEDPKRCNECTPNSIHCDFLNNSTPLKRCVIKHWKCDGTDDCGNNFDELHCPVKNKDTCIGSHYLCGNDTLIPRAYWCDGEADCPSMEDEEGCRPPQVITPPKLSQLSVIENSTVQLECQVSGRPVPTITWRFNWGYLPDKLEYNITDVVTNCSLITSTLLIKNISPDHSGIYTCEAISKRRVMAPDFSVTVTKGSICKRPFFNNDAWYPEFCLICYCSNLTDDCTSASGYMTNPDFIESKVKASDAAIINYKNSAYFEDARPVSFANESAQMYSINSKDYVKLVPDDDHFLGGSFNMRGSWLNRYGYPLTYKIIISGESTGHIAGPIVVLMGYNEKKIYYCTMKSRIAAYASNDYYENNIRILLWEQDRWFNDNLCTQGVQRAEFLELLRDVRLILFRVKYFTKQTDFKMSKITMQEAIKSKSEHSWVSRIEKCNCPQGHTGMSCEMRTK